MLSALSVSAQGTYNIDGNLKNAEGQKIYIYTGDFGNQSIDSTVISNGKFQFTGKINQPFVNGTLLMGNMMDMANRKAWQVSIEPINIKVEGDANAPESVKVLGGMVQNEQERMKNEMSVFIKPMEQLNTAYYSQPTKEGRDSVAKLMKPYQEQYSKYSEDYMRQHPSSYFATQFLSASMGQMPYDKLKATFDSFSPAVQRYGVNAAEISQEIATLQKVRPGAPAPDFTATDINGKPFTLSSLKGKVVIIDFWASWCVPCRKSNPHMLELYKKYHKKGLELVYVADNDDSPAKWREAVKKDGLVGDGFHHVLRGLKTLGAGRFDRTSDISEKYAIHFLPTKYLIDRNGNIVCKIDENEEKKLDDTLNKMFK